MKKLFLLANLALTINAFAQYTKLLDFAGNSNGSSPYGSLIQTGCFSME